MKIVTNLRYLPQYQTYLKILSATEDFFKIHHYLKLDLPVLSPSLIPEDYLEIFSTEFRYFAKREKLYLTPSPELFMKRLLVENIGDCYYLGKAFRNSEPLSDLHFPEFNILEFYKVNHDYNFMKKEIQKLLLFIADKVFQTTKIKYQNQLIDLNKPWEEISVAEAFNRYAKINEQTLFNHEAFILKAKQKGYQINNASYVDLFSQIYTQEIEPHLGMAGRPTIIYDYPSQMAALAKLNKDNKTSQRFEFYITGIELGDCYTELSDWQEQEKRFIKSAKKRQETHKISHPIDSDFIEALKKGLPLCSGIAIGVDRLAMIFANVKDIKKLRLINIQ